jgi:hypothetical protein
MAEPHVVTALTAKRTEMAGLVEHHKKVIAQLSSDLTHVDAMGIDEVVTGMRDYAGVEMTVLEAVAEQLTRLHDLLDHRVHATMTNRVLQ